MSTLITLLASLALAADASKEEKGDQDRLQGTWKVVSMVTDGKEVPAEKIKEARLTIAGNRYMLKGTAEDFRGAFKINENKTPKQIDTTFLGEDNKERGTALGIYELQGRKLKISWRQEKGERPTELVSKPDSGVRSMVLDLTRVARGKITLKLDAVDLIAAADKDAPRGEHHGRDDRAAAI